jgi:hypothetical protein
MMNKRNYQKELDKVLEGLTFRPSLLLHSCCAPCSSYVLVYLSRYFDITVLYYNPNIYPPGEFEKRVNEQKRLIETLNTELKREAQHPEEAGEIRFIRGEYDPQVFFDMAKGLESLPEGGERCFRCYELRMREAARLAAKGGYDYFTTTLSISPLKNAEKINETGERLEAEYRVKHLPSDFKKRDGYRTSCELSRKYELYRQDYCGCVFSKAERDARTESENNVGN